MKYRQKVIVQDPIHTYGEIYKEPQIKDGWWKSKRGFEAWVASAIYLDINTAFSLLCRNYEDVEYFIEEYEE